MSLYPKLDDLECTPFPKYMPQKIQEQLDLDRNIPVATAPSSSLQIPRNLHGISTAIPIRKYKVPKPQLLAAKPIPMSQPKYHRLQTEYEKLYPEEAEKFKEQFGKKSYIKTLERFCDLSKYPQLLKDYRKKIKYTGYEKLSDLVKCFNWKA